MSYVMVNGDQNTSNNFQLPEETVAAGLQAAFSLATLFKRDKNQFGCTEGQMRRGKCAAYNQWLRQQQEMATMEAARRRVQAIQDAQRRQKTKQGIVVGVSVGAIALLLFLLWRFKWSKK